MPSGLCLKINTAFIVTVSYLFLTDISCGDDKDNETEKKLVHVFRFILDINAQTFGYINIS